MWSLEIIFMLICVLISVAFLTLTERKILGYIQLRKGPNKVGLSGLLQPFSDAIKLFTKTLLFPSKSNFFSFSGGPFLAMILSLMIWIINPLNFLTPNFSFSILFFSLISSMSVYSFSLSGWGSNSWFAVIGCYRAIAQTISYEINLALILLSIMLFTHNFNFSIILSSNLKWISLILPLSFFMWLASILAESNRTPFDFAEGESELVSGFNTEFSGSPFALLFLAEYGSIIFSALLTSILFYQGKLLKIKTTIFIIWILWVRGSFPRFRYDKLMILAWTIFLPTCLTTFMICIFINSLI